MRPLSNSQQRIDVWGFLLFCLWPLLSFFFAVKNFKQRQSRILIVLFLCFFGLTISLKLDSIDGSRQVTRFINASHLSIAGLADKAYQLALLKSEGDLDLYTDLVNFLFIQVTDNAKIVFAFHALIFGIFGLRVITEMYDEFEGKLTWPTYLFLILVILLNPINNIHAIRFPIASWVFVYGTYKYIRLEKATYLIWCLVASLIHFSFFVASAVVIIYALLGNRMYVYLVILVISYVMPDLLQGYLSSVDVESVGEGIGNKISGYSRSEYVTARNQAIESRNWYAKWPRPILHYSFLIALSIPAFFKRSSFVADKIQESLLCFLILFLSFVNFGFEFDSLGRRFLLIWLTFAAIYLFRLYQLNRGKISPGIAMFLLVPIALWILFQIRLALEVTGLMWLIGNPILCLIAEVDIRLIELF